MGLNNNKVSVVGLGYVGLPLAALCAIKGYQVIGIDSNAAIVDLLQSGKSHIKDDAVESLLADGISSGNFTATTNVDEIADCSIYLICVPTPIDSNNDPDLKPLVNACELVAACLQKNDLVVVARLCIKSFFSYV